MRDLHFKNRAMYLLVFALSCVNRETAILLVLFYVVYLFPRRQFRWYEYIWMSLSQAYLYVLITVAVRFIFADSPGSELWIEPHENLIKFITQPYRLAIHLFGVGGLAWWMSRGWSHKPEYLRFPFRLFAPLLVVLYLVCGQAFELRVFWELSSLVILLSLPEP